MLILRKEKKKDYSNVTREETSEINQAVTGSSSVLNVDLGGFNSSRPAFCCAFLLSTREFESGNRVIMLWWDGEPLAPKVPVSDCWSL